jgi:hypothetical protein
MAVQEPQKKRHHYVPVGYLKRFVADDGFLYAYRKDEPDRPIRTRPEGIGFQTFYYSQSTPEGTQDNNRLEGGLSALENDWPALARRLDSRTSCASVFTRVACSSGGGASGRS